MSRDEMRAAVKTYLGEPPYESAAYAEDRHYSSKEAAYLDAIAQLCTDLMTEVVHG